MSSLTATQGPSDVMDASSASAFLTPNGKKGSEVDEHASCGANLDIRQSSINTIQTSGQQNLKVTVESTVDILHLQYSNLLRTNMHKNPISLFTRFIPRCNAVLENLKKVVEDGNVDEREDLVAVWKLDEHEGITMDEGVATQNWAYRGRMERKQELKHDVSCTAANTGRVVHSVRTEIRSLITSKWVIKARTWNTVSAGMSKDLYKRMHELQALLRLYLKVCTGTEYADPIGTTTMHSVKIALGRFFVNQTFAQKLSYFNATLEPLFGSCLPRTLTEIAEYFGISAERIGALVVLADQELVKMSNTVSGTAASDYTVDKSSVVRTERVEKKCNQVSRFLQVTVSMKQSQSKRRSVLSKDLPLIRRPGLSSPAMKVLHTSRVGRMFPIRPKHTFTPIFTQLGIQKNHKYKHVNSNSTVTIDNSLGTRRQGPILIPQTPISQTPDSMKAIACNEFWTMSLNMQHQRVNPCQTNIGNNQQYDSLGETHLCNGDSFNTPQRCRNAQVLVPMTPDVFVPETPKRCTSIECNSFGTLPPNLDLKSDKPGQTKFSKNQTSVDVFNQVDKLVLSVKMEFPHPSSSGSPHREKTAIYQRHGRHLECMHAPNGKRQVRYCNECRLDPTVVGGGKGLCTHSQFCTRRQTPSGSGTCSKHK